VSLIEDGWSAFEWSKAIVMLSMSLWVLEEASPLLLENANTYHNVAFVLWVYAKILHVGTDMMRKHRQFIHNIIETWTMYTKIQFIYH
jgi:hypothetical protein